MIKKGLKPKKFYIGNAINIGEGVEELVENNLPVAIVQYEEGIYYDEFSNQRVFIGENLEDVTNSEFLGLDYLEDIDNNNWYSLFVLKNTLVEVTRNDFVNYLKGALLSSNFEEFKNSLLNLGNSTIRWREYLKQIKEENEKVKKLNDYKKKISA